MKSQLAADTICKVKTTYGLIVLTGTLATRDAIDQLKNVGAQVKDVTSMDTSALQIAPT